MGTQRSTETEGVTAVGDAIVVRFKWRGQTYRPRLALKPSRANMLHAHRVRQRVLEAIRGGTFNMLDFFPDYRQPGRLAGAEPASGRTLREWAAVWEKFAARKLEHSTLAVYKRHLRDYWLNALGDMVPATITHEVIQGRLADLAADQPATAARRMHHGLSRKTQNNILIPLRGVFALISRAPGAKGNPVDGIENLKVQPGEPDPFTLDEVETALGDMRQRHGDATADYYEFAAFAGLRVSEQIALLWQDTDLRTHVVGVRRARVMGQEKERTKTNFSRLVELNDRAAAVLERQRGRTQLLGREVFLDPSTGTPWQDEKKQRDMWASCLRRCKIRHRPAKELRDSSVTFALQAGADPWYVARQHGHSVTTMMKSYAKWIPNADRGRNRAAINLSLAAPFQTSMGEKAQ